MAEDRIGSEDIFKDNLFDGVKKSAGELVPELQKVSQGLELILKQQRAIIEESKIDSAENIKKLTKALSDSKKAQEGLAAVTKELKRVQTELDKARKANTKSMVDEQKVREATLRAKGREIENDNKLIRQKEVQARADKAAIQAKEAATKAAQRASNQAAKEAKDRAKLNSSYAQASARLNDLRKRLKDLAVSGRTGGKVFKALQQEVTALDKKLKQADATAGQFQRNVGNYPSRLGKVTGAFRKLAGALGFAGLIFGIVKAFRNAFNVIKDFEQQQTTLAAVLQKTREETAKLSKEAQEYGATTFFTAKQVSELQTELAKLGFTIEEISAATEGAISLAAAFGIDVAQAAKVTAGTLRGFNLEAGESGRVADVIAKAYSSSAIDIEKFEVAVSKVAPIAASLNIDLETTTAVLSQLVNANFDASTAGTQFRNILLKLSNSSSRVAGELGFTVNSSDDLIRAFRELNERGIQVADTQKLIDVRSVALLQNIVDNVDAVEDLRDAYDSAGGAAKRIADEQLKTLDGAIRLLKSAWDGFVLSLDDGTNSFGQFVKTLLGGTASILNALSGLGKSFSSVSNNLVKSAARNRDLANSGERLLKTYDRLTAEIDNLNSKGLQPTTEQTDELRSVTVSLQGAFGDSVVSINEETKALEVNREELIKQINLRRVQADEEAATAFSRLKGIQQLISEEQLLLKEQEANVEAIRNTFPEVVDAIEAANAKAANSLSGITNATKGFTKEQLEAYNSLRSAVDDVVATKQRLLRQQRDEIELRKLLEEFNFSEAQIQETLNELYDDGTGAITGQVGVIEELEVKLQQLIETRDNDIAAISGTVASYKELDKEYRENNIEINKQIKSLSALIAKLKGQETGARKSKKKVEDLSSAYDGLFKTLLRISNLELDQLELGVSAALENTIDAVIEAAAKESETAKEVVDSVVQDINELYDIKEDKVRQDANFTIDSERSKLEAFQRRIDAGEKLTEKEKLQVQQANLNIKLAQEKLELDLDNIRIDREKAIQDFYDRLKNANQEFIDEQVEEAERLEEAERGSLERRIANYSSFLKEIIELTKQKVEEQNRLEEEALARETASRERQADQQFELAKQGVDNTFAYQENKAAESRRRQLQIAEQNKKQEEALRLAAVYFSALDARFAEAAENAKQGKTDGVTSTNAPFYALKDTFLAEAVAGQIAGFFATGVENFQGKGTGTSDSNLIAFSHGESVVTAKGTAENSGLVTAMNQGRVDDYFAKVWLPKFDMDNSITNIGRKANKDNTNSMLLKEIKALRADQASRPVQQVHVDSFGNIIETSYKNGLKTVVQHQMKKLL